MSDIAHWLEADELPKCQRCPAAADERSFLCEDHAGEADEEVDTLREQLRGAVADRDEALALLSDFLHGEPDVASHVARRAKGLALLARVGGQ